MENYTQIPNYVLDFLARTKLSPTQYRIALVVCRFTFGFHRKKAKLSLSFLSKATGCTERLIQREVTELVEMGIFLEGLEGRTRTLEFNIDHMSEVYDPYPQNTHGSDITLSKQTGTPRPNGQVPTLSKQTTKKESNKENIKENKRYIDLIQIEDTFFKVYNDRFKEKFGKDHSKVTEDQMADIQLRIDHLKSFEVTEEEFIKATKEHFETLPKGNDGKIFAFLQASARYFEIPYFEFS
ncbi:replication protein [Paenibacillus sp. MCAF9]|uniref:replication protein n=1 Tax=Paenibacillus sp. MCAF9 TaxID=3233046 RepID=UPI003F9DACDF